MLIASSVVLGVAGSRVATDLTEWASWLALVACASLLFVADFGRQIDEEARVLSGASGFNIKRTREDVTSRGNAITVFAGVLLALLASISAVVVTLTGV